MFMQMGLDLTIRMNNGYEFGGNQALRISISAFADDIVLFSNSFTKMQQNVDTLSNFLAYYNLSLNHKKCGTMNNAHDQRNIMARNGSERSKLPINKCEHYKYLGVHISLDNRYKKHQQEVKKNYRIAGKLLAKKAHLLSPCQMAGLINSKIISICRYGISIMNYSQHFLRDAGRFNANLMRLCLNTYNRGSIQSITWKQD
jgi:hypothetical protein